MYDGKITRVSKNSQQSISEAVTKETPKERYISPEKKTRNHWWFKIKITV